MRLGIIVAVAFWTAIAAGGFWGWLGFCALAAVAAYIIDRMTERN